MASMLSTGGLARASARRPWAVVGGWVIALVVSVVVSGMWLGGALTSEINFTNEPESLQGLNLKEDRLGDGDPLGETIIVRSDTLTVDDPAFRAEVERVTAAVRGLDGDVDTDGVFNYYLAQEAGDPAAAGLVAADRRSTIIPVTFLGDVDQAADAFHGYKDAIEEGTADGFRVLTVGDLSIDEEFNAIAERDLQTAEFTGLPIALLILVVVFGALVAAGIPVILALMSIAIAVGLTAVLGQLFELSFFVVNMITMIGLAVGIDYALFVVERYREERRRGVPKLAAIETAGGTASRAVLFSGITVVLALTGMLLIPTTIFRSLGLGAILVVIVAVFATMTLIPAVLALLGDRIDWPRRRRYDEHPVSATYEVEQVYRGFWGRTTRLVMARPVVSVVLAVALLGAMAIPYFGLERGSAGVETLPESEVKDAFVILGRDYSAGRLAPVEIVVDRADDPGVQAAIANLTGALAADPDVDPTTVATTESADGTLAVVTASLRMDANAPEAYAAIERMRAETVPAAFDGVSTDAFVTGDTAFNADFFTVVDDWTPIVFAFVLGLSFLLLLLVFRSVVIPAKAIVLNLLSVGAAYGLMVLVFQEGVGASLLGFQQTPTIEAWVPIFLFCVLFGLSMDYHVFLLSRIKEHYDVSKNNAESVAVGLHATAKIITGAALIMVVVFAGFAMGDLVMFQQMGFGLAVAVALDATIVRTMLVPAGMAILGKWNWYLPSWLNWLPNLNVEGRPAHAPAPGLTPPVAPEGASAD